MDKKILFFITFICTNFLNAFGNDIKLKTGNLGFLLNSLPEISAGKLELDAEFQKLLDRKEGCHESSDSVDPKFISPLGIEKTFGPNQKSKNKSPSSTLEFFFDFELIPSGKNGKMALSSKSVNFINLADFVTTYANYYGVTNEQLLQKSDSELASLLSLYGGGVLTSSNSIINAIIALRMSDKSTAKEAFEYASNQLKNASKEQKIQFIASYLSVLNENYEFNMIGNGPTYGEDRFDDDLHKAIAQSLKTGQIVEAGVCRHMHQMAVRLARSLGFNEAFGVGFRTVGAGHRTMVVTDPNNPLNTIQFNYGKIAVNEGVTGPVSLGQNGLLPDTGIIFKISDANDRLAIILPSELGGVLNRATGGKESDLGIRYENQSQFIQAGANTKIGNFRIFNANNPLGNKSQTSGIAYNGKINLSKSIQLESGVSVFTTDRDVFHAHLNSNGLYTRIGFLGDHRLVDRDYFKLDTFWKVFNRASIFLSNLAYEPRLGILKFDENKTKLNADENLGYQLGVSAYYDLLGSTNLTKLTADGAIGFIDVNNGNGIRPYFSTFDLDHRTTIPLSSSTSFYLGGGATLYDLGTGFYGTFNGILGAVDEYYQTKVDIKAQGRITEATPIWIPSAENSATFSLTQGIMGDRVHLGLEGRQSFDLLDNKYVGFTISGRLSP